MTGSDKLPGPFQIYHNPKASLSSGYFRRNLMRMVVMRRMLERILIIQLSNTSKGSSFNLVSTHLQIMSSGCPMCKNRGVILTASHFGPITRLSSHRGSMVSQWWHAACHCHGHHWARTSQMEGNSTSSVPICSLQKDGSSPECVSRSTRWFKNCFPGIHSLQSHWERKYGIETDPLPTEPEQENNGRWRKNNT